MHLEWINEENRDWKDWICAILGEGKRVCREKYGGWEEGRLYLYSEGNACLMIRSVMYVRVYDLQ